MRWNETLTLLAPAAKYQDAAGAWHEGRRTPRVVFCNEMTMGTMTQAHLRSSTVRTDNAVSPVDIGLRNEHMVQIRAIDYQGEDQVLFHGDEYEVIYLSGAGENRILTIGQRIGNDATPEGGDGDG